MALFDKLRQRYRTVLANRGIKEKLIIIFVVIKVVPLILLAWTAWDQVMHLGAEVEKQSVAMMTATRGKIREIGDIAVKNSVKALDERSREAIEELTTNTARDVATFLYDRDRDISYAATLAPNETEYRRFLAKQTRSIIEHEPYQLDAKGERWLPVKVDSRNEPEVRTAVKDNEKDWHYRPPELAGIRVTRPLYLEMTFIDLNGQEKVKVTTSKLLPPDLRNVSRPGSTYCRAESYFRDLQRLKPGEIAVSEVIGPYVGTPLIGLYTPKRAKEKGVAFAPEQAGYAGLENPVGKRFRGLIRWGMPVVQGNRITGYVTLALDHRHLKEFTDHIVPTNVRFTAIPDASSGNYAFIWDYKGRSIVHPRDHSIVGYDPATGEPAVPWLDTGLYKSWQESGLSIRNFLERQPVFDKPSLVKKPAPELTKAGLVGLDGRYLNFAPQCAGWHELTSHGGSGSFVIFWSGIWKLTTAAAIPYYTGRYGAHPRGFGYVTIGANVDEFHLPATQTSKTISGLIDSFSNEISHKQKAIRDLISASIGTTAQRLTIMTVFMVLLVIIIAVLMAGFLTRRLTTMISGIRNFQEGNLATRLPVTTRDEIGALADAFNGMAETLQQREGALRKSEEKYRRLIEQAREGVLALDQDGLVTFANPRMAEMLGHTVEEMVGRSYGSFIGGDGSDFREKLELRRRGISELYETELTRKDGQSIVVSVSASPMNDDSGAYIGAFGVIMDITERKRAEEELVKAKDAAETANRAKSQFLANMSHELRTPMNGVLGMIQLAQYGNLDAAQQEYLATAYSSGKTLVRIINDILDLTKIEEQKLSLITEPFSLRACLNDTINLLAPETVRKGLNLVTRVEDNVPDQVAGDRVRLQQVLTNLVGNAVKFTEQGFVEVKVYPSPQGLAFSISDSGIGIAANKQGLLFKPFSQIDESNTRQYGGTGLGLIISKQVVELMGGTLTMESVEGQGSTFTFTLPLEGVEGLPSFQAETTSGPHSTGKNRVSAETRHAEIRILIVEDEPTNRALLQLALRQQCYLTETACNGHEAVEMWEKGTFDLIIMDVQMPVMDGVTATRMIRDKERTRDERIPIIAMTAHAYHQDKVWCLEAGMDAYITKPVDITQVIEVVTDLVSDAGVAPPKPDVE